MPRNLLIVSSLLFSCAFSAVAAQQRVLPEFFAGWTVTAKGSFSASTPDGSNGPAATAAAEEYGLSAGERNTYTRGNSQLHVALYVMKDPSGAYGQYSFLRTMDMPYATLTEHSSMSRDRALVLDGNLVLDIRGNDLAKFGPDLKFLVVDVEKHAAHGLLPTLMQFLPPDNIVERSDHYILGPVALNQFFPIEQGDWLGFSHGAEAEEAQYRVNGHELILLIADFPTPQIAADELKRLENRFNVNGSNPKSSAPGLFAKRTVTKLSFVMGAAARAEAETLLGKIESGTQVTWDEPTFEFKEPRIEMMIVGAIVGTGTICLFAMVAGLAFGGLRLVVKRVLPDRVFDRSSHLQVLQLGLASKPINSEDFYGLGGPPAPTADVDPKLPDRTALRIFR